jgi:hypothetical protein
MTPELRRLISGLVHVPGRGQVIKPADFLAAVGVDDGRVFGLSELVDATIRRDPIDVEYALVLCAVYGLLPSHLPLLVALVDADWHHAHENVVSELAEFHDPETVDALYSATQWVPEYLDFDEARALAVKAIWGLGGIEGEAAREALERLAQSDVEVIRRNAAKQLARRSEKLK